MLDIVWPKVFWGKNGWTFRAIIDGKMFERTITERDAMGLAESIFAAHHKRAEPDELREHGRRCAI